MAFHRGNQQYRHVWIAPYSNRFQFRKAENERGEVAILRAKRGILRNMAKHRHPFDWPEYGLLQPLLPGPAVAQCACLAEYLFQLGGIGFCQRFV